MNKNKCLTSSGRSGFRKVVSGNYMNQPLFVDESTIALFTGGERNQPTPLSASIAILPDITPYFTENKETCPNSSRSQTSYFQGVSLSGVKAFGYTYMIRVRCY